MYYFINYLRTIATVLITNSHYSNIWPISDLAAGGLLGNILFFAASGFCLLNIKENFGKWYLKRIAKIWPVMIGFTLLAVLVGDYPLASWKDAVRLFLYPTNYIFLVWLMISYIAFYILAWLSKKYDKTIEISLLVLFGAWILTYFIFVDKSVYQIDDVEKPFILFLYFSSMLIGALFKKYIDKFGKIKAVNVILLFVSLIVYFGSKIAFSKIQSIVFWQILNQLSILVVLYFMFAVFIGLEDYFKKIPDWINKTVKFVAGITLHIYIVQFVIIRRLEGLVFPVNFLVTTVAILALACAVYYAEFFIKKGIALLIDKTKGKKENAESND
jgi:peptidoglycan/LPS O-acetylase OafA/YrhL